jgi:hypothetical protein
MSAIIRRASPIPAAMFPAGVDTIWLGIATGEWTRPERLLRANHGGDWIDV